MSVSAMEKEIESKGKFGFYVKNDFTFPINKYLAFKTGFGIGINNVDLKITNTYSYNSKDSIGFGYVIGVPIPDSSDYRVYGWSWINSIPFAKPTMGHL